MPFDASRSVRALALAAVVLLLAVLPLAAGRVPGTSTDVPTLRAAARQAVEQIRALAPRTPPEALVREALRRVARAGSYRVVSDAEQRLLPRGLPSQLGQGESRSDLRIEGAVAGAARARLALQLEGGAGRPPRVVTVLREGERTYLESEGEIRPIAGPAVAAAPGADPIAFLAASRAHRVLESDGPAGITRIGFEVDGPGFAEIVRQGLLASLRQAPPAPLAPSERLAALAGRGEVWIDERGLPIRIELQLEVPEVDEAYDGRVHLRAELAGFGEDPGLRPVVEDGSGGFQYGEAPAAPAGLEPGAWLGPAGALGAGLALVGLVALATWLCLRDPRRRRRAYASVVLAAIASQLLSPGYGALRGRAFASELREASASGGLAAALGSGPATGDATRQAAPQAPRSPAQSSVPPEQIERCGQGETTRDSDGEGLSDYVEGCLGTDPLNVDTDGDLLNDRLEVDGIEDEEGRRWTSDPLRPDSNNDGLNDKDEWPSTHGYAPSLDPDGDGLPNVWDPDNDGDGVGDGLDIAPFSYTAYRDAFELNTFRPSADLTATERTQLVFIHVQPEAEAHLRYSLSPLDWAYDDRGQVQVLGPRARELRLSPMLAIDTTISPTLAADYGVTVQEGPEGSGFPYTLLLPLSPLGSGGRIEAFGGMMAYAPEEIDELVWDLRMVWTFTGSLDTGIHCDDEGRHCESYDSRTSTLVSYPEESFRISGLSVQLSSDAKLAALATPERKQEDYDLVQAFTGLNETFVTSALPDPDPDAPDYASIDGAVRNLTEGRPEERFGITTTIAAVGGGVQRYANAPLGWQQLGGEVERFLDAGYERCLEQSASCRPDTPTLLYVTESDSGVYTLDDMAQDSVPEGETPPTRLVGLDALDIDRIHVATVRGTRIAMYAWKANRWAALSLGEMMEVQEARYPDLDPDALSLMRLAYAAWSAGVEVPVAVDGVAFDVTTSYEEVQGSIAGNAVAGRELALWFDQVSTIVGWRLGLLTPVYNARAFVAFGFEVTFGAVGALAGIVAAGIAIADLGTDGDKLEDALFGFQVTAQVFAALEKGSYLAKEAFNLLQVNTRLAEEVALANSGALGANYLAVGDSLAGATGTALQEMSYAAKLSKWVANAAEWLPIIGVVVGVVVAFVQYMLTISQDWGSSLLQGYAAAELIASVVLTVALYFIALIPVIGALFVAVLLLVAAVAWLISVIVNSDQPVDILGAITTWLSEYIFQAAQVTEVGDVSFGEIRADLRDARAGPVEGNTYRVWTDFEGSIVSKRSSVTFWILFVPVEIYYTGNETQKRKSHVYASWTGRGPGGAAGDRGVDARAIGADDRPEGWRTRACAYEGGENRCRNSVGQDFFLRESGVNRKLKALTVADFRLAFVEVIIDGLIPIQTVYEGGSSPDRDASDDSFSDAWRQDAMEFYFDVLPDELDELWDWADTEPHLGNRDRDADGLDDVLERSPEGPGTDWRSWDTDGDGLSDGFEIQGQREISGTLTGADPTLASTDGDGLDDRVELLVSETALNDPDSDDDGLRDDEEVCVGGEPAWTLRILTKTIGVCSNPLDADPDGDGLSDAEERAAGTSPFAFDEKRPSVLLEAGPWRHGPGGQSGTYLRSGQDALVTMTVRNLVANEAGGEVALCLGPALSAVQPLLAPAEDVSAGGCALPDGAAGTLLTWTAPAIQGAELQAAFRARVSSSESTTATARVELPFANASLDPPVEGETLRRSLVLTIDEDDPVVAIEAPGLFLPEPALPPALRGERFVLGGTARDDTTWIDAVELRVRDDQDESTRASWRFTESARSTAWSAAWDLPEDGRYEIRATATDAVGHASAPRSRAVLVDNTAPLVALDLEEGALLDGLVPGPDGRVTATLPIRVEDALSGVDLVQVSLDGRPYRRVDLAEGEAYPTAAAIELPWSFPGARSQGRHRIALRAFDRAGNVSQELRRTVLLDVVPPLSTVSGLPDAVETGASLAVSGHADDAAALPPPSRAEPFQGPRDALADATVWAALPGSIEGRSAAWVGDFDADGRADLALGLPEHDEDGDGQAEGLVRVLLGRAGGWPSPPRAELVDQAGTGPAFVGPPGAGLGTRIAGAGDFDGDGYDDLLVGDVREDRAFLVFGGPLSPLTPAVLDAASPGRALILGPSGSGLGAVAGAGDVNADGLADVLLLETGDRPRAHLVLGRTDLRERTVDLAEVRARSFPLPEGGAPAIGAGDLDGDGYDDLAIADPRGETGPAGGAPAIQLVRGTRYVTLSTPVSSALRGAAPLGEALAAAGDLDGDGYDDLAFGSGDGAFVALGGPSLAAPELRPLGVDAADLAYLAGVGDLNPSASEEAGRRLDDLVVGTRQGAARVVLGQAPFPARPKVAASIAQALRVAPSPYPGGADLNCDGSAELLVLPPLVAQPPIGVASGAAPRVDAGAGAGADASSAEAAARAGAQDEDPARVSPRFCPSCDNDGLAWGETAFDRIGPALASGARTVLLDPGVYEERVELGPGARLLGSGAAETRIQAPDGLGADDALLTIAGDGVEVAGLALAGRPPGGAAPVDGLRVASGSGLRLARLLLRDARRAIVLDGPEAIAEIERVTLVGNQDGVVALRCAPLDLRNAILAYNRGRGIAFEATGCPDSARRIRHAGFWANGRNAEADGLRIDPSDLGEGQVLADPRFQDVSGGDLRLREGSPMIDAGQPGDPAPPGAGERADLGYVEHGAASAYAGADYCATCANDGLAWGVDAFATIGEAVEAARGPDERSCDLGLASDLGCGRTRVVRVAPGTYQERIALPSGLRLLGSGADATVVDAGYASGELGSAIRISDARRVEVSGLTIRGFGTAAGSAGIRLEGATSAITLSRNLIVGRLSDGDDRSAGIALADEAFARIVKNTIVETSRGVQVSGGGASSLLNSNLLADYEIGVLLQDGGRALSRYNFLGSRVQGAQDYAFVGTGLVDEGTDVLGQSPGFGGSGSTPYHLRAASPALGVADPALRSGLQEGGRAAAGYWDRLVSPFALHFGEEGASSCPDAASGVASVQVGLGATEAPSDSIEATLPTRWLDAELDEAGRRGRGWSASLPVPQAEGRYRLYARSRDAAGNQATQVLGELVADGSPPLVAWDLEGPTPGGALASVRLRASVSDVLRAAGGPELGVELFGFLVDPGAEDERFLPGTWVDETWSARDGRPRRFFADIPLPAGAQEVAAVVRDAAGREARTSALRVETSGEDLAELVAPRDGQTFRGRTMTLRGFARLADAASRELRVYAGTERIASAMLPGEDRVGAFEIPVTLPAGERIELRVAAGEAARADALPVTITRDETPPALVLLEPAADDPVTLRAHFAGGASDESGAPVVEASFDGGLTWEATVLGERDALELDWSLDWVPPGGSDGVTVPALLRARDAAGNETRLERRLVVDNVPPAGPRIRSVDPPEGSYVESPFATLDLVWTNPVLDGSGPAAVSAALVKDGAELPAPEAWSSAEAGCSTQGSDWTCRYRRSLSGTGSYTLYLRAEDPAGNARISGIGPIHVGIAPPVGGEGGAPGSGQPSPPALRLALAAPQGGLLPLGPGDRVTYTLRIRNEGPSPRAVERLELESDEGGRLRAQRGARCLDCPAEGRLWALALDAIPPAGEVAVAIELGVPDDIAGIQELLLEARLLEEGSLVDAARRVQPLDASVPLPRITAPIGGTLRPGLGRISGIAEDAGLGVARVELRRLPDGPWRPVAGTRRWSRIVAVPPAGQLTYEARATDPEGRSRVSAPFTVTVDTLPPTAEVTGPDIAQRGLVRIEGRARDPFPSGGLVRRVQVRVNDGPWRRARLDGEGEDGLGWRLLWNARGMEPGVYDIHVRAQDAAGNWSASAPPWELALQSPRQADLRLEQRVVAGRVAAGGRIDVELRARNLGPMTAREVVLVTGVPPGTKLLEAPASCTVLGPELRCDLGALPEGDELALPLTLRVAASPAASWLRIWSSLRSAVTPDPDPANNRRSELVSTGRPSGRPIYLPTLGQDR